MVADPVSHLEEGDPLRLALLVELVLLFLYLDQLLLLGLVHVHDLGDQGHPEEFFRCVSLRYISRSTIALFLRALSRFSAIAGAIGDRI